MSITYTHVNISPSGDLGGEAPVAERGDDQPAPCVGSIRLGMARGTKRHQAVEIEVRAPLGALDDVVDLGALSGCCVHSVYLTGLALFRRNRCVPLAVAAVGLFRSFTRRARPQ
jgi:hypothetical protein